MSRTAVSPIVHSTRTRVVLQRSLELSVPYGLASAATLAAMVGAQKLIGFNLPVGIGWGTVFSAGILVTAVAAVARAYFTRPSELATAVAIDQAAGTKSLISTAWQLGDSPSLAADPFAAATLAQVAQAVGRIRARDIVAVRAPANWYLPFAALIAAAALTWLPPRVEANPVLAAGPQATTAPSPMAVEAQKKSGESLAKTINTVLTQRPELASSAPELTKALGALEKAVSKPSVDSSELAKATQKAAEALKNALERTTAENKRLTAQTANNNRFLRDLNSRPDENNDAAKEVREAMANGDLNQAAKKMADLTTAMNDMSAKQKQEAAKAVEKLAQDMAQAQQKAQQSTADKLQKSLQQQGLSAEQAKQLAQQMAQAAQAAAQAQQSNNPAAQQQAQQQLQKALDMAQKMANQGQGASQQQQQLLNQLAQQAAGQQLSAQQQQQLSQAMKQMAQAMQQQSSPDGKSSPQNQQQAQQQMQQAMDQMKSAMEDARQQQELNDAANGQQGGDSGQPGENGQQGSDGQSPGGQGQAGDGGLGQNGGSGANPNGGDKRGQGKGQGNGQQGPNNGGQGSGDRSDKAAAPFSVKKERSPSKNDEKGKLLASILIKDQMVKGASNQQLTDAAESALKEATDEVESTRLPASARATVKEYFRSIAEEARKKGDAPSAPPAPAAPPADPTPPKP